MTGHEKQLPSQPPTRKPIIGLCGGVGSGKSKVASLFARAGCAVINSDELNRAQLATPEVISELVSWWGERILDATGQLDRKQIAAVIFKNTEQRKRLEAYLHPRIARESERLVGEFQADPAARAIVFDSPLLIEAGLDTKCDAIIFVDTDEETRLSRVMQNRGWSEDQWQRREKSQFALDKKRARADHVVANNSSDLDELRSSVDDILQSIERRLLSTD